MTETHKTSLNFAAIVTLILAVLFWAATPLFLRSFIYEVDAWVANGFRYPFSAVVLTIPLLIFASRGQVKKEIFRRAIVPALVNLGGQTLWAWAPYYIEPAMLMFLTRISIIFAIIWSFLIFPDELPLLRSKAFWWGLGLSIFGFIGMNGFYSQSFTRNTLLGLLLALGNGVFLGFYGVSVRYSMRGVQPWISFPIIAIYTAVGVFIGMWIFGEPSRLLQMPPFRLGLLALSSLVGIAFAHIFFYYSIEHLGVSISSGCQLAGPFFTAVGSYFIFGEVLNWGQWLSGIVILAGAGFLLKAQHLLGGRHVPTPTPDMAAEIEEIVSREEE